MEGLPVSARGDSVAYRVSRFVVRNRIAVAAAVFGLVALAGTAVVAEVQRDRAERRFQDLRQFANFVLNDLDDSLRREGVTPARKKVVARALEYLDKLRGESGGNDAFEKDLVNGYLKVGDVQGNLYQASVGDSESALASYRNALAIARGLAKRDPANRRYAADATVGIADILAVSGKRSEAIAHYDDALKTYRELLESQPSDRAAIRKVLRTCDKSSATLEQAMDLPGALERSAVPACRATAGFR